VHYLDGRFVKYDTYGHFPSHLVWWSEGLAEYISKGDNSVKALKLLAKTDNKVAVACAVR
jgi:microbial collagenase